MNDEELESLKTAAMRAAANAYAPYSKFRVGAAVLTERGVFAGANVENASYGLSICAERVALAAASSAGARHSRALAIHFADPDRATTDELRPCGACRQWMVELLAPGATIHVANTGESFTLEALLPNAFRLR